MKLDNLDKEIQEMQTRVKAICDKINCEEGVGADFNPGSGAGFTGEGADFNLDGEGIDPETGEEFNP